MRVGYFSPCWPCAGVANGIAAYLEHLLIHGTPEYDYAIVTYDTGVWEEKVIDLSLRGTRRTTIDAILARTMPSTFKFRYRFPRDFLAAMQSVGLKIDILEVEESFGLGFTRRRNRLPAVSRRLHGPWFINRPLLGGDISLDDRYRMYIEGVAIKHAAGVTSPSRHVLDCVRSHYACDLPLAEVIANPVAPTCPEFHWQGGEQSAPTVLYVGRFDRLKGADVLLKAFRIVGAKNRDANLVFVGPDHGLLENGVRYGFAEYLEKSIPELDIRRRVSNFGKCAPAEICRLRKSATVCVVASRYENFPLSLLEAMSAGCPVVATAVGGIKEIVRDEVNGLLVEAESPESMAAGIQRVIADEAFRQRLSVRAMDHCLRNYHPQSVARQLHAHYGRVLSRLG